MNATPMIEHLLQEGQEQNLVRFAQSVLGEYCPKHPQFRVTEQDEHWQISVFAGQRGDRAGGMITVKKRSMTVTNVTFYQ